MLHSFLQHHKSFRGDLVIIHDGLNSQSRAILEGHFPPLKFVSGSPVLSETLDRLVTANPAMASRRARFLSLEILKLSGYVKVLFCDSDLLFQGSVADLFASDAELICCGDAAVYRGNARDPVTFLEVAASTSNNALQQSFNAGFMLLDGKICNDKSYAEIIAMISPDRWRAVKTGHTDQLLYNIYFAGRQTLVGAQYNYLLGYSEDIVRSFGAKMSDAMVLHYNGSAKPWIPARVLQSFESRPLLIRSVELWNKAFTDFLNRAHLQKTYADSRRPSEDFAL